MRESVIEFERLIALMQKEANYDRTFLAGLLDHKNATMAWFRDRQKEDIDEISQAYGRITEALDSVIAAINRQYDGIADTLMKEVELVEKHLRSYEKMEENQEVKP